MVADVETMFSALETPWHKLGVVTADVLTSSDALATAGLDWRVDLKPVFFQVENQNQPWTDKIVDDKYAVVRNTDNSCYGIVGSRYTPVQNMEAFNFMDALVDSGDAKYETAGSLNGGQTIFILMKLEKILPVDDNVLPYMLLTNTHDGSGALKVLMTPVRVVCSNTLRMALDGSRNAVSIRHTSSITGKVSEARNILGISEMFYDSFSEQINKMIDTEITKDIFDNLIDKMFPVPVPKDKEDITVIRQRNNALKIREKIVTNFNKEKAGGMDNAWGLLNAYNSYELWQRNVRGAKTANAKLEKQASGLIYQNSMLTDAVAKELIKC